MPRGADKQASPPQQGFAWTKVSTIYFGTSLIVWALSSIGTITPVMGSTSNWSGAPTEPPGRDRLPDAPVSVGAHTTRESPVYGERTLGRHEGDALQCRDPMGRGFRLVQTIDKCPVFRLAAAQERGLLA